MTRKSRFASRCAVVLVALLAMNGYVSAMKFSQPVELGSIFNTPSRGFIFKGENSNNGKSYINKRWSKNERVYEKGVATFGNIEDALYIYYDDNKKLNVMFGNKDGKNVFSYSMIELTYVVRKIQTDSTLVLYTLTKVAGSMGSSNWIILGRKSDDVFVKYLETDCLKKQYFQNPRYVDFNEIYTLNDTIVISYKYFEHRGEFRFKWDDKAQWFGVEQVVY